MRATGRRKAPVEWSKIGAEGEPHRFWRSRRAQASAFGNCLGVVWGLFEKCSGNAWPPRVSE
eukprot:4907610-Lingulodinium_polyedra.AAC.1